MWPFSGHPPDTKGLNTLWTMIFGISATKSCNGNVLH